jgi:hypothetical protein
MQRNLSRIMQDPLMAVLASSDASADDVQDEETHTVKQIIRTELEKAISLVPLLPPDMRAEVEPVESPTATLLPEMLSQNTQPAVETASEASEEPMQQSLLATEPVDEEALVTSDEDDLPSRKKPRVEELVD